eukprot:TRINITY_DN10564_c0_g1_i1.p1 TRINITY_DN10564_c0_g1~~TRINITY_DN10564_c0_g1_i1.p1  ORF type:complete len:125 (-),score=26.10 TRINITY_DN10564_c0_g1_i1:43-417(-)
MSTSHLCPTHKRELFYYCKTCKQFYCGICEISNECRNVHGITQTLYFFETEIISDFIKEEDSVIKNIDTSLDAIASIMQDLSEHANSEKKKQIAMQHKIVEEMNKKLLKPVSYTHLTLPTTPYV